MKLKQAKAQYTIAFKQEAIRLGQSASQVASTLSMPHQILENWLRF